MANRLFLGIAIVSLLFGLSLSAPAAEKYRLGVPIKSSPDFVLGLRAAEEKGFWKEQGLDVEGVGFKGGGPMTRSLAAGTIQAVWTVTPHAIFTISKGVPMVISASLGGVAEMRIWVPGDSAIRGARDLKGSRIALTRMGGLAHVTGQVMSKVLNLKLNFIAAGGLPEQVAAAKAGKADGLMQAVSSMGPVKFKEKIRDVLSSSDYLPRQWSEHVLAVRKDLLEKRPDVVKGMTRGLLRALNFIEGNPQWSVEKMTTTLGYSDEAARWIHREIIKFSEDGKINRGGLQKVRDILIEYGLIPRGKAVPVDRLYTTEVVGKR